MKRRKFLVGSTGIFTLSLSGCLNTSDNVIGSKKMEITNIKKDEVPTDMVDISVKTTRQISTQENPLSIQINMKNNRDRGLYVDGTEGRIFGSNLSNNNQLILLNNNLWTKNNVSDKCWKLEDNLPTSNTTQSTRLDVEDEKSVNYDVLGNHSIEKSCIEPGVYKFDTYYQLRDIGQTKGQFEIRFNWGFEIEISEVEN